MNPTGPAHLAARIRAMAANGQPMSRALLAADLETILDALDLVPVAHAALAYHDRKGQSAAAAMRHAWDTFAGAVERYRKVKSIAQRNPT